MQTYKHYVGKENLMFTVADTEAPMVATSKWSCIRSDIQRSGGAYASMVFGVVEDAPSVVRIGDCPYLRMQLKCPLFPRSVKNRKSVNNTEERFLMSVRVDAPIAYAFHSADDADGIIGGKFAWLATTMPGTRVLCYGVLRFDPFRIIVSAVRKAKTDADGYTLLKLHPSVVDTEADGIARLHYVTSENDAFRVRFPKNTILSPGAIITGALKCDYTGQFRSPYGIKNLGFALGDS